MPNSKLWKHNVVYTKLRLLWIWLSYSPLITCEMFAHDHNILVYLVHEWFSFRTLLLHCVLMVLLKLNSCIDLYSSSWHVNTFLHRILQIQLGVCGTVRLNMERQVGMITQQDLIWTCVYTGHMPGVFINFTAPHLCMNLHCVKFYFFILS